MKVSSQPGKQRRPDKTAVALEGLMRSQDSNVGPAVVVEQPGKW